MATELELLSEAQAFAEVLSEYAVVRQLARAYAFGHLRDIFAFIAGWGDVVVALLAPFVATRLARSPEFLWSNWLRGFHVLGLLDFVGAVGSGLIAQQAYAVEAGAVGTAALGELPLVLIPGFAVPLWICLHIAALI